MRSITDTLQKLPRQPRQYDQAAAERARTKLLQAAQLCPGCAICGGSGVILVDGKLDVCPTRLGKMLRSGLPEYGLTADEIDGLAWKFLPDQNTAPKIAPQIRQMTTGQVFLYGIPGSGKSIILQNVVAENLRHGRRACYITLMKLLQELRETYDSENDRLSARLDWYARIPVLALDEIDKPDYEKPFVESHTGALLDERWRAGIRGECLTVIASNQPPENLPDYIESRLKDTRGLCIHTGGKDARRAMPKGYRW